AFEGKSQLSVASAILDKEPACICFVKPMTPPVLEHIVNKCLAKTPDERWQSASDLASELKWVATSGVETASRGGAGKIGKFHREMVWLAIKPTAIALAIAVTYYVTRPASERPLVASVSPPPGVFADTSGRIGPPQISPDGTRLAFIGCKTESAAASMLGGNACSIWLRSLASAEAHEINDTNGAYYPFWSPEGREIGFFADGKLKRVSVDGSPIQVICNAPDARGGSWGNSGAIIFAPARVGPIFRVPAAGGVAVAITRPLVSTWRE